MTKIQDAISPNFPGLDTSIFAGQIVAVRSSTFSTDATSGTLIAQLVDPFGSGSSFATVGAVPPQIALNGSNIVRGSAVAIAGQIYRMKVLATGADGLRETSKILSFEATSNVTPPVIAPPPIFTAQPTVNPASGTVGVTSFTATSGKINDGAIAVSRRAWLLNGTSIGTTLSLPASAVTAQGTLTYQEFGPDGLGGEVSSAVISRTVAGAAAPTLAALSLSNSAFQHGVTRTVNIVGATSGSTIAGTSLPAGFTVNSAARTLAFDGSGSGASSPTISLSETLAGASNSPRSSSIGINIAAAASTSRAWTYADAGSNIASLHDFSALTGASGSEIASFSDSSPYARTLTGVTSNTTAKPKVLANGLAGKPVAVTSVSDKSYFAYPTDLASEWGVLGGTGFAILKLAVDPPSEDAAAGAPFGHFGSATLVSKYPSVSDAGRPFVSDFGVTNDIQFAANLTAYDLSQWHSFMQHCRKGDRKLRINGAEAFRNAFFGNDPSWGTAPKLAASPYVHSSHSYAIAVTFRRVVPLELLQKIEAKAHHDRGLQGLLPAGHPYKASPPTVSTADPLPVFIGAQKVAIEGDSITAGLADTWAKRLMLYYPTVQIQNFSVSSAVMDGGTGSNSLQGRTPTVVAYGAKAIMLLIGANDITDTTKYPTAVDWFAALKGRIAAYRAGGYQKVAVGTMLPTADPDRQPRIDAANALIRSASEIDFVMDFAAIPVIAAAGAASNQDLFSDGLHPTSTGQSYMYDAAEPAFLKALGFLTAGNLSVAAGAKLAFPIRLYGNRSTFTMSGADAASFELVNGAEGAVPWDVKTLRYAGDAAAVAGTKTVTVNATDEFSRVSSLTLSVTAA